MIPRRIAASRGESGRATPNHGRDVGGILWIVREHPTQDPNGLVNGILGNNDVLPDCVKQLIDTDNFAGFLGQADQEAHRARLELNGCTFAGNLTEGRINSPLPETKRRVCNEVHGMPASVIEITTF